MSDLGIDVEDVAKYKWMFSLPLSHGWLSFSGTTSRSTLPFLLFPPSPSVLISSSGRLFIVVILFLVSASTWVTPHGDAATSRDGCHRLEAIECQLISVLYTRCDFLRLSRLDVWSDPVWPTSLPAGRQVAGNLRQVLLLVCLPLPGRTPRAGHLLVFSFA